jgi:hypothetical protein
MLRKIEIEDDLNFLEREGDHFFFGKWKKTSIVLEIEDNFNFSKREDNLHFLGM